MVLWCTNRRKKGNISCLFAYTLGLFTEVLWCTKRIVCLLAYTFGLLTEVLWCTNKKKSNISCLLAYTLGLFTEVLWCTLIPPPPPSKLLFSGANRRWIPLFNCTNLSPTFLQLAPIFRSVFCWIQSSSHQRSGFPCSAFQIFDNRHACYSLTEDHKTNNNKITAKSTENPHNIPPTQWIKQGGL